MYFAFDLALPICFMFFKKETKREKNRRQHKSSQPTEGYDADFDLFLRPCVQRHTLSGYQKEKKFNIKTSLPSEQYAWDVHFRYMGTNFSVYTCAVHAKWSRVISCGGSGVNLFHPDTHQMKMPRLCEAHRGALALQSAHVSK